MQLISNFCFCYLRIMGKFIRTVHSNGEGHLRYKVKRSRNPLKGLIKIYSGNNTGYPPKPYHWPAFPAWKFASAG
jgi:hypothetical protein